MSDLLTGLLDDLRAEGDQLRATVDRLGDDGWLRQTPAAGWTVATSVAHLLWTDEVAILAAHSLHGEAGKEAWDAVVLEAIADPFGYVDAGAHALAALPRDEVLERWAGGRTALQHALTEVPDGMKLPWFGPPMSPASMATARFMETWAHALDVYDAAAQELGQRRPEPTDRIRHVAHLGVRTRNFAFGVQEEEPPAEEFRVELTAPSGEVWAWGPDGAAAAGGRVGVRLLPARHPARAPRRHGPGRGRRRRRALAADRPGVRRPGRRRAGGVVSDVLRVGNCSGFYGDRLSAMREQLEGGRLDVLTGDYLAELTMLILGRDTMKDPSLGYARTFARQLEDCLGLALEQGVRIVSNAGGLNPAGLADRIREVARGLGLDPQVAHVEGDDLRPLGLYDGALTANAYLGGFGIAAALTAGADVVVTGRVTDASVVVGPAVAHHGWTPTSYDELAGAVVAGHVIECGAQATGGNFSGFRRLVQEGMDPTRPLGFPVAEIAADGSSVITKHDGTGGAVTVDTVTAQLVYEIQTTHYLNPDVTADLGSIRLAQEGPDRVAITDVRGQAPPERLKVCVNELGGFRNQVEFVLTGLDVEEKAEWVRTQLAPSLTAAEVSWSRVALPQQDADTEEGASTLLRCTVMDPQADPVGRRFTGPAVELALASYPGFTMTTPPQQPTPYGVYRPEYVERSQVAHTVVHADGRREVVADPTEFSATDDETGRRASPYPAPIDSVNRRAPFGTFVHARSGDKGGDANVGLWVANDGDPRREARITWLAKMLSPRKVRELLPEAADLDVEVYVLPHLGAVNVVIRGLLGQGVAASTRFDPQAKGLGEWLRSRIVHVQEDLL